MRPRCYKFIDYHSQMAEIRVVEDCTFDAATVHSMLKFMYFGDYEVAAEPEYDDVSTQEAPRVGSDQTTHV